MRCPALPSQTAVASTMSAINIPVACSAGIKSFEGTHLQKFPWPRCENQASHGFNPFMNPFRSSSSKGGQACSAPHLSHPEVNKPLTLWPVHCPSTETTRSSLPVGADESNFKTGPRFRRSRFWPSVHSQEPIASALAPPRPFVETTGHLQGLPALG
jgi:hypothetical protein